ncbi:MAG TPA: hypothetical protein VEU29_05585 [Actinomycetota bacterium]|nr:hypothetical protein [Actinomycetota bacterium]
MLVALSLFALGMACSGTLSFLSGIATLKVVEVVFGYAGTAEA